MMDTLINLTIPLPAIPPLLGAFVFLSLALFAFFHKPFSSEKILFTVLCLETVHWEVVWLVSFFLKEPASIYFAAKFAYFSIAFLPFTFYHLIVVFLEKQKEMRYVKLGYGIACFLVVILFSTDLFVSGYHVFEWGYFARAGTLYPLFIVAALTAMLRGVYMLIQATRNSATHSLAQNQVRYLLLGFGLYFFCALDFRQVYGNPSYPIGTLFFLLSYLAISYAITHHQLLEPKKIAELIQREKFFKAGIIAAGIHHDLKSPLYVAKGTLESYLCNVKDGIFKNSEEQLRKAQESVETAVHQLNRAHIITTRLLETIKPKKFNSLERISLQVILNNLKQLMNYHVDENKIKITFHVEKKLYVLGKQDQIEEALFNLLLNGCQAMETRGGELKIYAEPIVPAREFEAIKIQIMDTGPGFRNLDQKKIFTPFYSSKGDYGTGLGLFITKQLIEKMNGKIWLKSSANGITVMLTVPGGVIHERL